MRPSAPLNIGDRQGGPLLLRYGTEEQRERLLPPICRGEIFFCIGMSEPDSGSDLASIRSRAERVAGGWRLNGTKLWTSGAALSDFMIGLFRSGGAADSRREDSAASSRSGPTASRCARSATSPGTTTSAR